MARRGNLEYITMNASQQKYQFLCFDVIVRLVRNQMPIIVLSL
jgi:hypothetical protein